MKNREFSLKNIVIIFVVISYLMFFYGFKLDFNLDKALVNEEIINVDKLKNIQPLRYVKIGSNSIRKISEAFEADKFIARNNQMLEIGIGKIKFKLEEFRRLIDQNNETDLNEVIPVTEVAEKLNE